MVIAFGVIVPASALALQLGKTSDQMERLEEQGQSQNANRRATEMRGVAFEDLPVRQFVDGPGVAHLGDYSVSVGVRRYAAVSDAAGFEILPPHIDILLTVGNSNPKVKGEYTSWTNSLLGATLTDDLGNNYRQIRSGPLWRSRAEVVGNGSPLYAGRSVFDMLIFELPIPAAKWLYLELPGSNLNSSGKILYRLPAK